MADGRNPRRRLPRNFRDRVDMLNNLKDNEVKVKYRLSRQQIIDLHDLIEDDIQPRTMRSHAIQAIDKDAINQRVNNIKFPTIQADLASIKQRFYQVARMPNCIGAVDGTLIPIIAPRVREDIYVCRKGYHAINVQAVVTPDMRCLHKTGGFLQITPEKAAKVFVVCAKLHNMCIDDAV
ncbi:HARB1-like protein [Mya arenaria]|uniref:HARB1-like protein n=1 Tax=Mya arenaria TaxID=6604 RepID=A0ABY7EFF3_MYAAR|nr:HARB1-like protein [Mya arenaria]